MDGVFGYICGAWIIGLGIHGGKSASYYAGDCANAGTGETAIQVTVSLQLTEGSIVMRHAAFKSSFHLPPSNTSV